MLEAVLDDFQDDENAVESFILQLLHNADILPPNVVLGTSVISIMDVGRDILSQSCNFYHCIGHNSDFAH